MKIITSIYAFFLVLFSILINIRVIATAAPVFVIVLSFVITALAIVILCICLNQLYITRKTAYYSSNDNPESTVKEDIRNQISAYLMHTSESKVMFMDVIIGEDDAVGLSTLEMPHITSGFQDGEGIIWFRIYGYSEPVEFDTLTLSDVKNILEFFRNR